METQTPPADAGSVTREARASALAQSLECLTESDFCLLAEITPATAENWRKRGKGPSYILVGNAYLYPRGSVADHLRTLVRERRSLPVRDVL